MDKKDKYRAFCKSATDLPIFMQDWFLDVVCQDDWDVVLVENNAGIMAALPFFLKRKYGFKYITMPLLCKMMGPYLLPIYRTIEHEHKLFEALIVQLPEVDRFVQDFHYTYQNWLPFYWKGYQQTTRYTYLIPRLGDLAAVWNGVYRSYRNNIFPKAKELLTVRTDLSLEVFFAVHQKTFDRQGIKVPFSFEYLSRLDGVLAAKKCRQIFFAVDQDENVHAVFYMIWDQKSAYCHLMGDDPNFRKIGGSILLTWEAIKYASEVLQLDTFDFEGSMIQPIELVRRNFGAIQQPYFNIRKTSHPLLKFFGK
jgi:Acetyltransferase (GNAT) domain